MYKFIDKHELFSRSPKNLNNLPIASCQYYIVILPANVLIGIANPNIQFKLKYCQKDFILYTILG